MNTDLTHEQLLEKVVEQEKEILSLKLNQNGTSESLFQTLFNDDYSIKLIIDSETGQIVNANKSACTFYGYSHDEITKKYINEINELTDEQVHEEMKAAKLNKRNCFNFKHQLKNGEIKDVEVRSGKIEVENITYLYSNIVDVTERNKIEKELIKTKEKAEKRAKKNEIKYRLIVENQNDLIAIIDADKTLTYVSPNYCKTFGVNEDEILGTSFFPLVHPDDRELVTNSLATLTKPPYSSYHEERAKTVSGWRWFAWSVKAVFEGTNIVETIAVGRDISEKKEFEFELQQAKEKAEENEEKHRRLIENSNSIIMEIDMDTLEIINCNSQLAKLFNKNVSDFIGVDLRQILPTDVLQKRIEFAEKALLENKVQQFKDERNGKHFLHSYIPYKTHNNRFVQTETHDITLLENAKQELIKAKEKAEESERKLLEAQELSHVGNWDYTIDTDTVTWSKELFNIFERSYDLPAPQYSEQRSFYTEESFALLDKCIQDEKPYEIELDIITSNGNVKQIISKASVRRDKQNKIIGLYGTAQDITKQKNIEKDLISAKEAAENANKLKTEFLHNMSHEIRTPLNGIMGFSEMLNNPNISEEKRRNHSKIIMNSSQQLLRVIDDILEISTLETKQTKLDETEFCLNDFLMELYAIFSLKSEDRNVPIYLEKPLHDKEIQIISDKTKLNKILSNLIENAIKFTAQGSVEIGYSVENELLKLYVKDTGIGISAENQQKIFERFSQEDTDIAGTYGGLGLGLSICKENAQLLGGDITLESKKGSGSTFIVTIPYKPAGNNAPKTMKPTSEEQSTEDKPVTILVAEDEEMNYLYIEALFEYEFELNYNLIHAKNGKEALDICMENKSIDIVLMDIKMPVMKGNEATQKIKKRFPDLPVIAQTAYSTESEKREAMKHGYDDFMSKPIDKDRLFETINKFVKIK